ncbi:MAG TPA: response regulator [Terriglobales bacterium]|nr:response regulator [Terriglobales bacterium]
MRILLADDSVTAQNMGKKILSEAGHEVVCVSNGAAALKKATEEEPDLVILDIYMPGYSGLEVCQRLKEAPATANLPVVLTVGKLEPFRKEDAQRVRAEALIVKPFEASELAAAVGRFGEIVAAAAPKAKSKGKLGPQAKTKPQWDEPAEDEFVTTTQKLEEEGYVPGSAKAFADSAPERPEATAKPQPAAAASEFEVAPAPKEPEPPAAAHESTGPARGGFGAEMRAEVKETSWPASASAEFTVRAEEAVSASDQPPTVVAKAAAAAAGADFPGAGDMPEFPASGPRARDFEVAAPADTSVAEPAALSSPQVTADAPSLPGAPDLPSAAMPELSAAGAEPYAPPATDPAFDPDRTQWATQFPTHFGIQAEEAEEAVTEAGASPIQEPDSGVSSAPPDEIAAILSNLPGGSSASEPPRQSEDIGNFGERPWPIEASSPGKDGWKAEEVPVEDRDSSVSLADEMEKVSATGAGQLERPNFAEPEAPPTREAVHPARIVESPEEESQPASATKEGTQANAVSASGPADSGTAEAASSSEQPASEPTPAPPEPDRVAGVMQSAAMAIATRATVSAVASQLHQPAPETATTGPSAIEELVGQVLERLKPKLIAEIKRELKATEEE